MQNELKIEVTKTEEVLTSETFISFYQNTRGNIPEGCHLHTRRRENVKPYLTQITAFSTNISYV
jgi:hypothetical protein